MNKTNLIKHIAAFMLLVVVMASVAAINLKFYQTSLFLLGGYQIGTWCDKWARAKWPLRSKE